MQEYADYNDKQKNRMVFERLFPAELYTSIELPGYYALGAMGEDEELSQERESLQQQEKYYHKYTPVDQFSELTYEASLTKKNLGNVREIVSRNMPGVYDEIDDIRQSKEEMRRTVALHHSRGRRFADQNGVRVLEFDIAGSGYRQFRTEHKGFHGKFILNEAGQKEASKFKKKLKISWYNKVFSWLPGIKSVDQIQEVNAKIKESNKQLKSKYLVKNNADLKLKRKGMLEE